MILITGATGTVGSEVITALLPAQASHIRVLTRNPGAVFPDGTQKVVADPASALAQMASYGMPEELAHAIIELFRSTAEPYNSEPTGDITAVAGRPARSFTDWAQAHRTELLTPEAVQIAATTGKSL